MKATNIVIVVLTLAVAYLGYQVCVYRAEKRKEAEFRLIMDKATYDASARGDIEKIKSITSIFVLSDVRDYERRFGMPTGTGRFASDFVAAQIIAQKIESELVPLSSILTNEGIVSKFGSNLTIKMEQER